MQEKLVGIGSTVTVEVYLGEVKIEGFGQSRRRYLSYALHNSQTLVITKDAADLGGKGLHPDSFAGRALLGCRVADEVEVNIGGLPVEQVKVGQATGNHLKYKVLSIS